MDGTPPESTANRSSSADLRFSSLWNEVLVSIADRERVEHRWIGYLKAIYPELTIVNIASRFLAPWRELLESRVPPAAMPRRLTIHAADLPGWQVLSLAIRREAPTSGRDAEELWLHFADTLIHCVGDRWHRRVSAQEAAGDGSRDPGGERGVGEWSETGGMVGSSPVIQQLARECSLAGQDSYPVLLLGETGAGKEVAAKLIHHFSGYPGRFVALNCAALPDALIESELFGHVRGAFTGAQVRRDGLFHEAEKGTLLLDEISEIPTHQQAKVLRAIQDGLVRRIGSSKHEQVDVRVIGTSNRDLRELLDRGVLRRDLYYRLAVHQITVPPLREHPEDIPELTAAFLTRWRQRHPHLSPPSILPRGFIALREYSWPGNVRELEHVIYRLATACPGLSIGGSKVRETLGRKPDKEPQDPEIQREVVALRLDETERHAIRKALRLTDGNKAAAARLLGVSRKTIYNKIKRYGLRRGPAPRR